MAQTPTGPKSRTELKAYFETGDKPTQAQFAELINNLSHATDDKATIAEAQTGTSDVKFITARTAKASVDKFAVTKINNTQATNGNIDIKTINNQALLGTGNIDIPVPTNITGNSATATKLASARTINGVAFDGSQNIVIPSSPRIIRIVGSTPIPLDNINTNQNISFTSINLEANKTYSFKGKYFLTTGPIQHSTSIGFSGTSQITSMEYVVRVFASAINSITGSQTVGQFSTNSMKVINSASSTATIITIEFEGIIRTGALAGTFIPQIKFSANPTGTNNLRNGTYIELNELGSDTI